MANEVQQQTAPRSEMARMKEETIDAVAAKITKFQQAGEIHFPASYSPQNALKSAWLVLQETVDRSKRPVLESCTRPSIINALLNMVIQGLNPGKKQGYFIAYGQQLIFQRSYFGTRKVAMDVTGATDIVAQVVYEGDEFEYEIDNRGTKHLVSHKQNLENVDETKIKAAYCTILWDDREYMDVMTIEQIKKSWRQSQMNPVDENGNVKAGSTHAKFSEEMAKKTVMNRTCKGYINSSNDSSLVIEAFHATDDEAAQAQLEEEIAENANAEVIDIQPEAIEEAEDIQEKVDAAEHICTGEPSQFPGEEAEATTAKPGF